MYVALLMLRWIKSNGLEKLERDNAKKAQMLYSAIDNSRLFKASVAEKTHRSNMNVCFTGNTPAVEQKMLELCEKAHITGIKGHRAAGGFRASLYNAVPLESVESLLEVMNFMEQTV
jgi:phosphoserine aminotransferase